MILAWLYGQLWTRRVPSNTYINRVKRPMTVLLLLRSSVRSRTLSLNRSSKPYAYSSILSYCDFRFTSHRNYATQPQPPPPRPSSPPPQKKPSLRENIYTLPNLLTISRIAACPVVGWSILEGNFTLATALLAYAGITDLVSSHLPPFA